MAQHQQALVGNQAKALNDAVCYQTDIQYWSAVARQEIVDVAEDFRNSIAALVKTIKERVEVGPVSYTHLNIHRILIIYPRSQPNSRISEQIERKNKKQKHSYRI